MFNVLVNPSDDIPEQLKPTLLILSPVHTAKPNGINGKTLPIIEKIANKKGNSERIYRNTLLFLVCSELGIGKLQSEVREYLACQKITLEYNSQLETEQRQDLKKRMEDVSRGVENAIVAAYSIVVKYSAKNGADILQIRQFKDYIDSQINNNIIDALKEEEWLLDSVGLNTLKNNNLLPTNDNSIKAKDVFEAFLRYDDKPMITGLDAISRSLQRYCTNGEFCIATGDGKTFTRYFLNETIPFFDVEDSTYWLVDRSFKPVVLPNIKPINGESEEIPTGETPSIINKSGVDSGPSIQQESDTELNRYKSITVSGRVHLEQYMQLFNSFIMPLAQNRIEIEIKIKGKSTQAKPLTNSCQEYKIVKESAKQLGLDFEEEI